MNNDNLISMNKVRQDIKALKLISIFLGSNQRKEIKETEKQIDNMVNQISLFNTRFSSLGWCAYDSIKFSLVEDANKMFEEHGIQEAEKLLVNYYKTEVKDIVHWIKNSSGAFMSRYNLLQHFFDDHFSGRYHASIPLALIIIDGAVNDYTKSKGFFAEETSIDAWDCVVGCSDGLIKLKEIFNRSRKLTNSDMITMPFRNGILHGRDINYANEYVSCKCISLMFAIADWMKMKSSEDSRKEKYIKSMNPSTIRESIQKSHHNRQLQKEISDWERRNIVIGREVPLTGIATDYSAYPYIIPFIEMTDTWRSKNYGKLSNILRKMYSPTMSQKKRAGECRKLFESKIFGSFELTEVEERACALSKIEAKVSWISDNENQETTLTFGCLYESNSDDISMPWRNNGEWVLVPWNVSGLYT